MKIQKEHTAAGDTCDAEFLNQKIGKLDIARAGGDMRWEIVVWGQADLAGAYEDEVSGVRL